MIVFDLCCAAGDHRFEAWFASSESFSDQQGRGLINCPVCGDDDVKKAVMAPRVSAKSNRQALAPPRAKPGPDEPSPDLVRKLLADIAAKQAEMLPQSRWGARMKGEVVLYETDCNKRRNVLRAGVACGIAVNGQFQAWVRPYRLPDEHMIRRTLDDAV